MVLSTLYTKSGRPASILNYLYLPRGQFASSFVFIVSFEYTVAKVLVMENCDFDFTQSLQPICVYTLAKTKAMTVLRLAINNFRPPPV